MRSCEFANALLRRWNKRRDVLSSSKTIFLVIEYSTLVIQVKAKWRTYSEPTQTQYRVQRETCQRTLPTILGIVQKRKSTGRSGNMKSEHPWDCGRGRPPETREKCKIELHQKAVICNLCWGGLGGWASAMLTTASVKIGRVCNCDEVE